MKSFNEELESLNAFFDSKSDDAAADVMSSADREEKSLQDIKILLSEKSTSHLPAMALKAKELTARHFGNNINLYIPMYVSNECSNSCRYCGFNINSPVERKTLTTEEAGREMENIAKTGMKNILILTGEHPQKAGVSYIEEIVKIASGLFTQISLEVFAMDTPDYERLVKAGATGLYIYQETYNRDIYAKLHQKGPKSDFDFRLSAPERAAEAGFRSVGIGALLGLDDPLRDMFMLFGHAKYLMKKSWRTDIGLSFPRITEARGTNVNLHPVSEKMLAQYIIAARLCLERAGIALSTRESAEFRDNMTGLGVTKMSAGSKTSPGGYEICSEEPSGEQFSVHDTRNVEEVAAAIRLKGYYAVFKDWEKTFK